MAFNNNLNLVYARAETTYGDKTLVLTGADAVWVKTFQGTPTRESNDRDIASPYGQGAPPVPGLADFTCSFGLELGAFAIAAAPDLPAENQFLLALGFGAAVFDAGPPLTQTYALGVCTDDSLAVWWHDIDCPGGSDANLHKYFGVVLDGTLVATPGQSLMINCNGQGNGYDRAGGASVTGAVYPPFKPTTVGSGEATFTVHAPGGDIVIPDRIASFECALGRTVTPQRGVRGQDGTEGVAHRGEAAPDATMVVDVTEYAAFDVWDAINNTWPVTVEMHFPARASGINSVGFIFTGFITDAPNGDADGTRIWTLGLKGGWPGTPGTNIGTQPADGWLKLIYTTTP